MIITLLIVIALCLMIGGENTIALLIAGVGLVIYWAFWVAVIAVAFIAFVAVTN